MITTDNGKFFNEAKLIKILEYLPPKWSVELIKEHPELTKSKLYHIRKLNTRNNIVLEKMVKMAVAEMDRVSYINEQIERI